MSLPNQYEVDPLTYEVRLSWASSNDALGILNPLVLSRNVTLENYITEVEQYTTVHTNQKTLNAAVAVASGTCDELRVELVEAIASIRTEIKYIAPIVGNEGYFNALPKTPQVSHTAAKVLSACEASAAVWDEVLALTHPDITQPVLLGNGLTLAQFRTKIEELRTSAQTRLVAVVAAKNNRLLCKQLLKRLFKHIVEYRIRVIRTFPKDSIHRQNLPVLHHYRGPAPDAVTISGFWDGNAGIAKLNWSECASPNLSHYEVHGCLQRVYAADQDVVVAQVPKGTLNFETTFGLAATGSEASFKVYAVTTTGRERGSNTVSIERLANQQAA